MCIDLTVQPVQLQDADVFRELWVLAEAGMTEAQIRSALDGWGRMEGEHVWLTTAALLQHGRQDDSDWRAGFVKMVDYAQSEGWTRKEPDALRAHIVWRSSE